MLYKEKYGDSLDYEVYVYAMGCRVVQRYSASSGSSSSRALPSLLGESST